jgi:TolA-binding protein
MAETTKLSVEKALEKLRRSDPPKAKNARLDDKIDTLDEEIKRMRAQRLRVDQRQRKRD